MGTISDYLENKWLNHVFHGAAFTVPSNIYIALSTTTPSDDGTGVTEPGSNYIRKAHNVWNAGSGRAATNNGVITFIQATGAWGTITHYAIYDAITGGNFLGFGALTANKIVVSGNTPYIATTDISISATSGTSSGFSDYLVHKLLDHTLKTTPYSQPTIYVGLSTTIPTDAGNDTEPNPANNYARKSHANWFTSSAGATYNTTTAITFNTPNGTWGSCVYATIYDAASTGNYLARGDITDQTPGNGDTVRFNVGDLDVTLV